MQRHRVSRIMHPERQHAEAPAASPAATVARRPAAPPPSPAASLQRAARLGHRVVQTKLTLGPADDAYERQADATARQVMQWIASPSEPAAAEGGLSAGEGSAQRAAATEEPDEDLLSAKRVQRASATEEPDEDLLFAKRVQRASAAEEPDEDLLSAKRVQRASMGEEPEEEKVFTKSEGSAEGGPIGGDVERSIDRARSGGSPLDPGLRAAMEPAFGADFSGVQVHTGSEAHALNDTLQARAFTTGSDIFFRQGEYQPDSSGGRELVAHELTHVVQQGAAQAKRVRRAPEDELEEEA